jgi:hypothetical protein
LYFLNTYEYIYAEVGTYDDIKSVKHIFGNPV